MDTISLLHGQDTSAAGSWIPGSIRHAGSVNPTADPFPDRRRGSVPRGLGVSLLITLVCVTGCVPRQSGTDQYPNANQLVTDWKDTQWIGMPAEVDAIVEAYLARPGAPPGVAVGIMQNNAVRHLKGYGLSDRERNRPFTHATPSVVGSVSKTLTALGVLRLAEMGLVHLEDRISEYLPVPSDWQDITIRQLLGHASGLEREARVSAALSTSESLSTHLFPWVQPPYTQLGIYPSLVLYSYAGTQRIGFDPDSTARYSNAGYLVLGALIENVAGANTSRFGVAHSTYESFVWRYVGYHNGTLSDPNQMVALGLNTPWRQDDIPLLAKGYTWNGTAYVHTTYDALAGAPAGWEGPAGGWTATIGDMVRLMVAIENNRIVSNASRNRMMTPQGVQDDLIYGLGVILSTKLGFHAYLHDGAYPGYKARYTVWPGQDFGVALLANESTADMSNLTDDIAREFIGSASASRTVALAPLVETPEPGTDDDPGLGLEVDSGIGPMPELTEAMRRARWEELNRLERQHAQARSQEALIERRFEGLGCGEKTEGFLASAGLAMVIVFAECRDNAGSPSEVADCISRLLADYEDQGALPCVLAVVREDIRRGLISYWPFEEAGSLGHDWVSGNHLVAVGSPESVPGQRGNAVRLSGDGSYLRIDHDPDPVATGLPIFGAESYTIAMWVKGPPQTGKYLFSHGSSAATSPLLILQTGQVAANNARFDVIVRNNAGSTLVNHRVSTGLVFDNTWRHVAWVDDRGEARLYIDGELDPTGFEYTRSGTFTFDRTAVGTLVRATIADNAMFEGAIDELMIWERALSQAEVREVMTEGLPNPYGLAPTILANPTNVTAAVGGTVRFSVATQGARPLKYQWTRDGKPIEGATDATYEMDAVTLADSGATLSVAVSNPHGMVVSRTARLVMPQASPPTVYFGEDVSPHAVAGPNQVPRPASIPRSLAAADLFRANLPGVVMETFESFETDSAPEAILVNGPRAALSGSRQIISIADPMETFSGVFPVSGTNLLLVPSGQVGFCALDFSFPQTALGFYVTDLGETAGLRVTLVTPDGWRTEIDAPVTRPQGSGGAFFFGVIDRNYPFTRVELERIGNQADGFGIDDLMVAAASPTAAVRLELRRVGGDEVELSWPSLPNRTYTVEYRSAVASGAWVSIGSVVGDGRIVSTLDRIPAGAKTRFYRLVVPGAAESP